MLKVMLIPDVEKFLEKIQTCRGDVLLHLPDGSTCDLKNDHTAMQMLKMLKNDQNELDISLTDPRDYPVFLNFMMRACA